MEAIVFQKIQSLIEFVFFIVMLPITTGYDFK